ncbi:MAG TPA: S-adenosylmethionine:tRNA ribosyltransferase-isomerase, partial [Acidobacteriota bacterium]|nr:S-adenosylmethionine:tRNA ribosyltransferase-isomerase [Acidobacteriota bacterium]
MKLDEFRFDLPDELIAQEPVEPRDHSRLMVVNRRTQQVSHRRFFELPELLPPGCLTVLNDTKVFPARLEAERESGGKVEIFLLHPLDDRRWEVLLRPARRCGTGSFRAPSSASATT